MLDIIQLYKDYKIRYWTEGSNTQPGWINIKCIHCDDSSNHLGFNLKEGYFNCWKCGSHETEYTISRLLGIPNNKVAKLLSEYETNSSHRHFLNRKEAKAQSLKLPGSPLSKYHKKYLQNRNFDFEYIEKEYGIKGTGPGELWNGMDYGLRIIIPIIYQDQLVSFQGRDITGKQNERYKGCPVEKSVLNYKHILYNIDKVQGNRVVVVEGITDVWRMGSGFVSSFGTTMTSFQIRLLSRFDEIVFLFDSEVEAQNKAYKYGRQLASLGKSVEVMSLELGQDPADLSDEEAKYLRNQLF